MFQDLWLLVSAVLVFLMQAGFLCLESGSTRSKNSINVAAKNISDFMISAAVFWLIGFGLMFGESVLGLFGSDHLAFGEDKSSYDFSFFLFQMMFCGTAATLTSGAVAERMTFLGYLCITIVLSVFIYPVTGHWAWAGLYQGEAAGWLEQMGFVDFAGSTVVHSVGGWMALSAVLIVGPRLGRFDANYRFPSGSNLPMATMGTLLIWFGWFGFNGGSTLVYNAQVPQILVNTSLSAIWGGLVATFLHFAIRRYVDVSYILNGVIAGLVGITASCHAVAPADAALIGGISGVVVYLGTRWINHHKIDDALAVVPVHLFAGIWGTLAVALFGDPSTLGTGLTFWQQLGVQVLGIVAIGVYAFGLSYILMRTINHYYPLRVSEEAEKAGLNITEHRANTELIDLLGVMEVQQARGDFTSAVAEEPFTEVGQIARKYNQVIARVNQEMFERDSALMQFKTSERRKSAILDSSMDCIVTIDSEGRILEFNPSAERTLGCLKRQAVGKDFVEKFVLDEDQVSVNDSLEFAFSNPQGLVLNRRNRLQLQRVSGNPFPAEITITSTPLSHKNDSEYTLHIRDITREEKLQSRLRFLAYKDPLTSLSNRTHLMKSLVSVLIDARELKSTVALMFLDLDKFKNINDTLGHKAGDELLCEVARRLTKVSRQSDLVSRWGGDEFVVVLSGAIDIDVIKSRAQCILDVMREPIDLSGKAFSMPTSIGIALSEAGELNADELIQKADIAMYHAKMQGRNNYQVFAPEMAESAAQQVDFERLFVEGLEQEQFELRYQPKVYRGASVVGLEALSRWRHPEEGDILPSLFIPLAEQSDLIIRLDQWVITSTLKQLKVWQDSGLQLVPVSVNISGRHLIHEELLPFITEQLETYGIDSKYLQLEITEGVLIQDVERCIQVLKALKELGLSIAIDDFGTGYSSLNYLKRLPIDVLKIDQSFVSECDILEEDQQICLAIVHLAKSLNLDVVAEGVETELQMDALMDMGCDVFQGYLFYRPLSKKEATMLLAPRAHDLEAFEKLIS